MDKTLQEKARCIRTILNILIGEDNTALKVIEFIAKQEDFTVTQADVIMHLKIIPTQRIYQDLERCGILEASNEKGIMTESLKRGRAMKKYYRVNKKNWKKINDFIENYE